MRLIIILLFISCSLQAQDIYILDKAGADSLRRNWGPYAALDPVALPDGTYAIPTRCMTDPHLSTAFDSIAKYQIGTNTIELMPDEGKQVIAGRFYKIEQDIDEESSPLVKARITHTLTSADVKESPLLFQYEAKKISVAEK